MTRSRITRLRPAPLLLVTLCLGLLATGPADARRAGGGRNNGLSRSISATEAPLRPAVRSGTVQGASAEVGPATANHHPAHEIGRESALLVRRAQLDAQRQGGNAGSSGSSSAIPGSLGAAIQAPGGAMPTVRAMYDSEPEFNRFTALPVIAAVCEIKPVMRDDDYIACGANPPESPMGNRR